MVEWEDMSSHGHTKSPATYGTISSEKDLKSKIEQLLHSLLKGHIERSRRAKDMVPHKTEPHPQHSNSGSEGVSQIQSPSLKRKGLGPISRILATGICIRETSPQNIWL